MMSGSASRPCQVRHKHPFAVPDSQEQAFAMLVPCSGSERSSHRIRVCKALTKATSAGPGLGHASTVWGAAFEAGGKRMVSCSDDNTLKVRLGDCSSYMWYNHRPTCTRHSAVTETRPL